MDLAAISPAPASGDAVGMSAQRRSSRLMAGALLLSAAVLAPVGKHSRNLMLLFGGAVLLRAASSRTLETVEQSPLQATAPPDVRPARHTVPHRSRLGIMVALATLAVLLIAGLTVLRDARSSLSERAFASANPTAAGGRAFGATSDPQLHLVAAGDAFTLLDTRVEVAAANVCRDHGLASVAVPVTLSALRGADTIGDLAFQLLDARRSPHDPAAILMPARRRGTFEHAAPPPPAARELLEFRLAPADATGILRLDVQSAVGASVIYRVLVRGSGDRASSPSGGSATCASPGGAA